MTTRTVPSVEDIRERLGAVGQEHVLRFYDSLSEDAQQDLLQQIDALDLEGLPRLIEKYVRSKPDFSPSSTPRPASVYPANENDAVRSWDRAYYRKAGETLLRAGKVAAFTVAGGQGSRLGFEGPKGKYPAGAVTKKPLFAMLGEWVLAAQSRYGAAIPWYIMTSPINHEETVEFFREQHHFGLNEDDIIFFPQGVMPSFDLETGKLLLAEKGLLATNPDGHGGSLRALSVSGALDDMRRRGIEQISYFQVDNPIVRAIDPVFIGLHVGAPDSSGEMSAKVVRKTDPKEKVGVVCSVDGKHQVIEYSDLPDELAEQRNQDGSLAFSAGSIAIHMLSVEFVQRLNNSAGSGGFALPFHRAEKKVAYVDLETGERVEPSAPNAVKLETFVFDALPFADKALILETERVEEFAPIKNADGNDSPATCRAIQTERAALWLETAGIRVARRSDRTPDCVLELSPLTATTAEDLQQCEDLPKEIKAGEERAL